MSDLRIGGDDAGGIARRRVLGVVAAGVMAAVAGCGDSGATGSDGDTESTADTTAELAIPEGFSHYREKLEGTEPVDEASKGFGGESKLTTDEISQLLEGETNLEEELEFLVEKTETDYIHSATAEYLKQKEDTDNIIHPNKTFASIPGANEEISEFIVVENGEIQGVHGINGQYNGQNLKYTTQNGGEQLFQALYEPDDANGVTPEDLQGLQKKVKVRRGDEAVEDGVIQEIKQDMYETASMAIPGVGKEINLRFADIESGMALYEAKYGDGDGEVIRDLSQEYSEIETPESYDTITVEYDEGWELTPENGVDPVDPLTQ